MANSAEIEGKIRWISQNIDLHIKNFSKLRENNKKKALVLHMATTFLAAIITVLLGLNVYKLGSRNGQYIDEILRMIALILGALVTTISAFNAFFGHKYLWINNTKTRNNLYKLKADFDYFLTENHQPSLDGIEVFKTRLDEILENANFEWEKLRKND